MGDGGPLPFSSTHQASAYGQCCQQVVPREKTTTHEGLSVTEVTGNRVGPTARLLAVGPSLADCDMTNCGGSGCRAKPNECQHHRSRRTRSRAGSVGQQSRRDVRGGNGKASCRWPRANVTCRSCQQSEMQANGVPIRAQSPARLRETWVARSTARHKGTARDKRRRHASAVEHCEFP